MSAALHTTASATLPERAAELASARERLSAAIERAIAILDEVDDDPDLEPDECDEVARQPELRGGADVRAF